MLPAGLRRVTDGVTPYFCLLLAVVTLGPHQFGFHLVRALLFSRPLFSIQTPPIC